MGSEVDGEAPEIQFHSWAYSREGQCCQNSFPMIHRWKFNGFWLSDDHQITSKWKASLQEKEGGLRRVVYWCKVMPYVFQLSSELKWSNCSIQTIQKQSKSSRITDVSTSGQGDLMMSSCIEWSANSVTEVIPPNPRNLFRLSQICLNQNPGWNFHSTSPVLLIIPCFSFNRFDQMEDDHQLGWITYSLTLAIPWRFIRMMEHNLFLMNSDTFFLPRTFTMIHLQSTLHSRMD